MECIFTSESLDHWITDDKKSDLSDEVGMDLVIIKGDKKYLSDLQISLSISVITMMSSFHIRLSNPMEALNLSISGSTFPVNRPPHSFLPWLRNDITV